MDSANQEPVTKSDLAVALAEMHEQLEQQKFELLERVEKVETTLLNEFRKWAVRLETQGKGPSSGNLRHESAAFLS